MRRIETVSPITINIAIIVLSFKVWLCFTDDAKVMGCVGDNMDSVNLKLLNWEKLEIWRASDLDNLAGWGVGELNVFGMEAKAVGRCAI